MTVQELIDALNKVKDKSKEAKHRLVHGRYESKIDEIRENEEYVVVY